MPTKNLTKQEQLKALGLAPMAPNPILAVRGEKEKRGR